MARRRCCCRSACWRRRSDVIAVRSRYERPKKYVEDLAPENRQRALATTKGQAYLFAEAVSQQARRLRASTTVTHTEHQADAVVFVYAVRTVILLGELAVDIVPPSAQGEVQAALDRCVAVVPDATNARDALAHLDEYIVGFGKQRSGTDDQFLPWFSRAGTEYTVRIGALAIEVDAAEEAAVSLASAIMLAED